MLTATQVLPELSTMEAIGGFIQDLLNQMKQEGQVQ